MVVVNPLKPAIESLIRYLSQKRNLRWYLFGEPVSRIDHQSANSDSGLEERTSGSYPMSSHDKPVLYLITPKK